MANTIQDKLTYLSGTKDAIKQAIIGKGVEVSDTDTFRSYADKIEAIQSGGGGTVNLPDGTKFGYSPFTTVPTELFPYLETQTDLSSMFKSCEALETIPLFDTSRVTDMSWMLSYCSALTTVPQLDTSRCTNMSWMLSYCSALTTVYQLDTSRCTDMNYMLAFCESLTTVPQLNTSSVQNVNSMFQYCKSLQTIPLLNFSKVNSTRFTLGDCKSLTNLGGFTGLSVGLDLADCSKLTVDSVMNVINYAADMTSSPKTLTLHKNTFNKLSQEQIATATAKGWNIAHW